MRYIELKETYLPNEDDYHKAQIGSSRKTRLTLKHLNKQASLTETKILTTTRILLLFELGVIATERPVISVKEVLDCEYASVLVVDTHCIMPPAVAPAGSPPTGTIELTLS